ncbi:alpha/beta fold hydrolase [Streptomyces sp. AM 2-1-1]|uniref:bifunctional 3-oxoadipate enol-lactonase/4-carboxymuconolactone decarboxylase PcaDC n=1 Tax=Streptomyces sp. AM 2-1-1 TaxID=3028709 RepID=UPI0023B898C0|nr:alpha/beta fold hydrolase [Streptomyces sp. AM 2-1-1]WEH38635.1 alpha/beta fold hydrolase [Streptomyces sp. AM 2-1-1]
MTGHPSPVPHFREEGPSGAPPLLLGPSLGTSMALWDGVAPALSRTRRVVRWDLPGHGGSPAGLIGAGATVADLGRLVLSLADTLALRRFSYAGVSLGGAVGLWLAAHHPERVDRLAVVCSSARFGDPRAWRDRAARVRARGTGPVADGAAARWFTPGFTVPALLDDLRAADPGAYAACCDALASYDLRPLLSSIGAPTLAVAGREDPATPPAHAREIADGVPGAALLELPGASHLAPAERPEPLVAALRAHFDAGDGAAAGSAAGGQAVRRAVLGDAHVDRAVAATTPFTARFQDFITRYAWGEVWTDPTLPRRERSLVTLTALVAHGHMGELALHVRAAVRNGLTPEEIGAVLLQTGVYCGVPAANAAFGVAGKVLAEMAEEETAT